MKSQKGFTLIELLVVVAIIGILATVVLASLGSARDRARDAAAKAALSQLRAEMELEATNVDGFGYAAAATGNACRAAATDFITEAGNQAQSAACFATVGGGAYAAEALLNNGNHFCVDSTGFAGEGGTTATAALLGTADAVC